MVESLREAAVGLEEDVIPKRLLRDQNDEL